MQSALHCSAVSTALELRARRQSGAQASTALPAHTPCHARVSGLLQQKCRPRGNSGCRKGRFSVVAAIKRSSEKHVVCHKTLIAKQDQVEKVAEMCKDVLDFSQGKATQRSSGILEFKVSVDQYEPNVFYFWERYDGNASMGRHNTCTEIKAFMENIQEYLEGPVGLALYEWQDGKIGNCCVQGGPKGEGGLDDATGAGGSGGASHKQTSSVVDLGAALRTRFGTDQPFTEQLGCDVQRGMEGDSFGMGSAEEGFKFPWQKE